MKKIFLILFLFSFGMSLPAKLISPGEALGRVKNGPFRKIVSRGDNRLKYISDGETGATAYIYTNDTKGFFILSADDAAEPVLGYSDDGVFDERNIPCGMQSWLGFYSRRIDMARNNSLPAFSKESGSYPFREPLEPAVKTKWSQDTPFNNLCPLTNGKHCVTGCVAAAMAQILNLYRYDGKGSEVHSYDWWSFKDDEPYHETLSYDFTSMDFDWENMLDDYSNGYTEIEADAVADLMYACGIATDMMYSLGASASFSDWVPYALWHYLGYNAGIRSIERDCYKDPDLTWDDFVYEHIKRYGAVLYNGITEANEGHAFICDGYSEDGFFHFNWGWSGISDGWFRLDALCPERQGIGGSAFNYEFNYTQSIHAFMDPEATDETFLPPILCRDENFNTITKSTDAGGKFTVCGKVSNSSQLDYSIDFGCLLTDSEFGTEGEVIPVCSFDLRRGDSKKIYNKIIFPADMPEGVYCMRPVITWDGLGYWWTLPWKTKKDCVWTEVKDGKVTFNVDPDIAGVESIEPGTEPTEFFTTVGTKARTCRPGEILISVGSEGVTKIIR